MKIKPLAKFIGLALSTSTVVLGAMPILAEEADGANEEVKKVVVTGSRIKRVDVEGATPVTVITAAEIRASGLNTVAEVLNKSPKNSFGSWGGGANNSWSSQSTVDLRGAGIRHTLLLIDGQRMAKSAVLNGGSANLNTIPVGAVERIEILSSGASAIYGTDAMAGVINIILRKDYEGLQITGDKEQSDGLEGGDTSRISIMGGLASDKGSFIFNYEHSERSTIYERDRWYNANQLTGDDPVYIQSWSSLSTNARNIWRSGDGSWDGVPMIQGDDCSVYNVDGESGFSGVLQDSNYPADRLCGYNYTNESGLLSGQKTDSMMTNFSYELSNSLNFSARMLFSQSETNDVSAPSTAFWYFDEPLPSYTANGVTVTEVFEGDSASYRLNTNGNRVAQHTDVTNDILLKLEGSEDSFDWYTTYQYSRNTHSVWGTGYAQLGAIPGLVGEWDAAAGEFVGWDPRMPGSEIPAAIKANFDKFDEFVHKEFVLGLTTELFDMPAGAVQAHFGASYKEQEMTALVDQQAEAGRTAGGNGGSSGRGLSRTASAAYFEVMFPVTEQIETTLAARYDSYSDFGSNLSPMLTFAYRPTDTILVRASWGKGFFAPTLTDLYTTRSESYYDTTDWPYYLNEAELLNQGLDVYCDKEHPDNTGTSCGSSETEHHISGNPNLEAEESDGYNIGFVWDINDTYGIDLDFWHLEIENEIGELNGDDVTIAALVLGDPDVLYPGATIVRRPGSGSSLPRINYIDTPTVNSQGVKTREGLDLSFNADFEFDSSKLNAKLAWSHYLKYESRLISVDDGEVTDVIFEWKGRNEFPEDRINLAVDYEWGNHAINWFTWYVSSQKNVDLGVTGTTVDNHMEHNLTYTYSSPWNAQFSVGVRNLTDKDPEFQYNSSNQRGGWSDSLYNAYGKRFFVSVRVEL